MWIDTSDIPSTIWIEHDLPQYIKPGDNKVLVEINGGMYGLPQAGKLAQDKLVTHLASHGYHMCPNTTCLFKHESRPIEFTLIVDDFAVMYTDIRDANHLIAALSNAYPITTDWSAGRYNGFTLTFNYATTARTAHLSMPGYTVS